MKYIYLLFIILPFSLQSQHREEITETFNDYFSYMENGNLVRSLDFMHPGLFKIISREELENTIHATLENPDLNIKMKEGKVLSVSKLIEHNDRQYAVVDYGFLMTISLRVNADPAMFERMKRSFIEQFGEENIRTDPEAGTISILQKSTLYAVRDPAFGTSWKFIEKGDGQDDISRQLIPAEVLRVI